MNAVANNSDAFVTPLTNFIVKAGGSSNLQGQFRGIIVQSILGSDSSTPQTFKIGFNHQPPATMYVRDSFSASALFGSAQIYNSSAVDWTIQGMLFRGKYVPGFAGGVLVGGGGLFTPIVYNTATLKAIPTVNLPHQAFVGEIILYVDNLTLMLTGYQLRTDGNGMDQPGRVVPNDWNLASNPYSWYQVL